LGNLARMFRGWFGGRGGRPAAVRVTPSLVAQSMAAPRPVSPGPIDRGAEDFADVRVRAAHATATRTLWQHALGADAGAIIAADQLGALRASVLAILNGELADRYFPRRPTLMPRLMAAVHDPNAAATRLAGIIAQDPVLTGNVLRLANSAWFRVSTTPIDTLQRAIVMCGTDGLQALAALALTQPVFRGESASFGRLPVLLWERTERAAAAAELYAQKVCPGERNTVQLLVLLRALGPLVVFRIIDEYYRRLPPDARDPACAAQVLGELGSRVTARVAAQWGSSPQICQTLAALDAFDAANVPDEVQRDLMTSVEVGELLGSVSVMIGERVWDSATGLLLASEAGMPQDWLAATMGRLQPSE
jgi:HD-like signal output (HDOD) protein